MGRQPQLLHSSSTAHDTRVQWSWLKSRREQAAACAAGCLQPSQTDNISCCSATCLAARAEAGPDVGQKCWSHCWRSRRSRNSPSAIMASWQTCCSSRVGTSAPMLSQCCTDVKRAYLGLLLSLTGVVDITCTPAR